MTNTHALMILGDSSDIVIIAVGGIPFDPLALIPLFAESVATLKTPALEVAPPVLRLIGNSKGVGPFLSILRVIMIGVSSGDVEFEVSSSDSSSEVMYIQS